MFIFVTTADKTPMIYEVNGVTIGDEETPTRVSLGVKIVEGVMTFPGGVTPASGYLSNLEYTIPLEELSAEEASVLTATQWLVSENGPYKNGVIVSKANYPLAYQRAILGYLARTNRDEAQSGGCTVTVGGETKRIETDLPSRLNVSGAVSLAIVSGDAFSMDWRMADNSIVTLNSADMIAMGAAVGQFVSACQFRKNELDAITDAYTEVLSDEDFEAAKAETETGWPS